MLTILAHDLCTVTGWALSAADGPSTSAAQSFKPGRFEGRDMRYLRSWSWLTEKTAAAVDGIGAVYFEEGHRNAGVDAAHDHDGFLAAPVPWGHPVLKRCAGGRHQVARHRQGNADKGAAVAAVRALGPYVHDDIEADALALLCWATEHKLNLSQTQVRGQYEDDTG